MIDIKFQSNTSITYNINTRLFLVLIHQKRMKVDTNWILMKISLNSHNTLVWYWLLCTFINYLLHKWWSIINDLLMHICEVAMSSKPHVRLVFWYHRCDFIISGLAWWLNFIYSVIKISSCLLFLCIDTINSM